MDARILVERANRLLSEAEEANVSQLKQGVSSFDQYQYLLGAGHGLETARIVLKNLLVKMMKEELSDDE